MNHIFSQPTSALMTINGSLDTNINLEMLCVIISPRVCKKAEIIKFIGFNKIYFYDPEYAHHTDDNKYFFNQCSFEFKNKIIIKLFSNGTYIITGCKNEQDAASRLSALMGILIAKKYAYIPVDDAQTTYSQLVPHAHQPHARIQTKPANRLALIYNVQSCKWKTFKIALANYSISLDKFEFNKYKVLDIVNIVEDSEKKLIESVTDIFKYSSVSIKLRNTSGNIDIYKNRVIISIQNSDHYPILLNFFDKYKYKLISIPAINTISKLIFLNSALALKLESQSKATNDHTPKFCMPKKVTTTTNTLLETIRSSGTNPEVTHGDKQNEYSMTTLASCAGIN